MGMKGVFFTIDGILSAILMITALILTTGLMVDYSDSSDVNHLSQDIVNSLSNIKVSEIDNPYIQELIDNGTILYPDNTIIEQIGEFYVLNQSDLAINLTRLVSQELIPDKFGFELLVDNNSIYNESSPGNFGEYLASSRRMISGIEKFKPIRGATSKVFLEGFSKKEFSSYAYFGGFIGQGNITVFMDDIPDDAVFNGFYLELDVGDDFEFEVNGVPCLPGTFVSNDQNMTANAWNITDCAGDLVAGSVNYFSILFTGAINESYIAGGYVRASYITNEFTQFTGENKIKYWFPDIDGIVNLYDAFYVPGTVNSMEIYLKFNSSEASYMTVGDREIHKWEGDNDSIQEYLITNDNLSTPLYHNLDDDYYLFHNNTVPIRFAAHNDTFTTVFVGGDADVILITDLSGSMKKATDSWGNGNSAPNCENFIDNPNTRRTRAAVCLDKELVDMVMNYSGNRLWPVYMKDESVTYYDDPEDKELIQGSLDTWYNDQGKGKTCLACVLNQAYDLLDQYSNDTRKKYVILMTDGCPTHCADGSCTSTSTEFGDKQCDGLCDTSGSCGSSDIGVECQECVDNPGATLNTLFSAQRLKDDLNATIYSIGFGPLDECSLANETLLNVSIIGEGSYQHSSNTSQLQLIYQNISYEILNKIIPNIQSVSVKGTLSKSHLFGESYIEIDYTPITEGPAFDEIAVSIQTDQFSTCAPTFDIPDELRVTDAKVLSYSADHWADGLQVNGEEIYNLSNYLRPYRKLGDPFFIYIPVNKIVNGTNDLVITTGDSPDNRSGCGVNNSLIYTGLIKSSVSYSNVLPYAEGCSWFIEFEDGENTTVLVPSAYSGTKECYYKMSAVGTRLTQYDGNDTYDVGMFELLDQLDYNDDGRLFLNLENYDFTVSGISVGKIPYPWGPAIAEVRVWK